MRQSETPLLIACTRSLRCPRPRTFHRHGSPAQTMEGSARGVCRMTSPILPRLSHHVCGQIRAGQGELRPDCASLPGSVGSHEVVDRSNVSRPTPHGSRLAFGQAPSKKRLREAVEAETSYSGIAAT